MQKRTATLIWLATATFIVAVAAKPEKQIISYSACDGTLVFIKPRKIKGIEYDITLNSTNDSVAVTFTLHAGSTTQQTDSTTVNDSLRFANERIYVEPESKGWRYRLRFRMSAEEFGNTFCKPGILSLTIGDSRFANSEKAQRKEAEICLMAKTLMELNKQ